MRDPHITELIEKYKALGAVHTPLSPKERADSLSLARKMTNLTIKDLIEKYQSKFKISIGGWQGWEFPARAGLSLKGAIIASQIFACEGVIVTPEWLYYGIGTGPRITYKPQTSSASAQQHPQDLSAPIELTFFKELHPGAIDFIVEDNDMMPRFAKGEYVAGIKRGKKNVPSLVGLDCIIQTIDGKILLRKIQSHDKKEDNYLLITTNTNSENAIMQNVKIEFAAPVIWQRRQDLVL